MAMNQRNLMLAGGGVAVALVVGWVVLGQVADGKAEAAIEQMLDTHGMRDQVRWEAVSASPFGGSVRLDEVRIEGGMGEGDVRIARIDIDDFIDEPRRKRAEVRMHGVATGEGFSPLGGVEFVQASGRSQLPPATVTLHWEMDLDDDAMTLALEVDQPEVMKARLDLALERVGALARLAEGEASPSAFALGGEARPRRGRGGGPPPGLAMALQMLESIGEVRLKHLEAALRDDGYIKRSIALHKRYGIPVSPADGSAAAQRDKRFQADIGNARGDCEKDLPVDDVGDRKKACATLIQFVSGEEDSIRLTLKPQRPVSFSEVFEQAMKAPARLAPLLRPEIDS
ncbi:hypothetical protein [Denitromonas iodatirespirans]|uniref:Uncharacterized protein n=1 Tax=Denitromonas iodatirespirans TaxID=2795389 RepID=A0A944DBG7_DENI1|nr:hypothetical protein [Denitromonas iodatirespirans]MBT0961468.1 hypothetical protein [Denitromonas iodatirespirans]